MTPATHDLFTSLPPRYRDIDEDRGGLVNTERVVLVFVVVLAVYGIATTMSWPVNALVDHILGALRTVAAAR